MYGKCTAASDVTSFNRCCDVVDTCERHPRPLPVTPAGNMSNPYHSIVEECNGQAGCNITYKADVRDGGCYTGEADYVYVVYNCVTVNVNFRTAIFGVYFPHKYSLLMRSIN